VRDSVIVNDRWGAGDRCKNGGYWTCEDRYNPHDLIPHKWENAMTIDGTTWGFARNHNLSSYLTIEQLMESLISTVAYGGNLLLNVGPTWDGTIVPIFQERLLQMGGWLKLNGEAIYNTRPWRVQNQTIDGGSVGYYTMNESKGNIYYMMMGWPGSGIVELRDPLSSGTGAKVSLIGYGGVEFGTSSKGVSIKLPVLTVGQLPCQWAWVLILTGFK